MTINVLTFGADPSGKNDSTTAFSKAIEELIADHVEGMGGASLVVPAGTYKLSGFIWGKEAEPTDPEGGASRPGCGSEPVGWCDT